jgi:hypothetical protein
LGCGVGVRCWGEVLGCSVGAQCSEGTDAHCSPFPFPLDTGCSVWPTVNQEVSTIFSGRFSIRCEAKARQNVITTQSSVDHLEKIRTWGRQSFLKFTSFSLTSLKVGRSELGKHEPFSVELGRTWEETAFG